MRRALLLAACLAAPPAAAQPNATGLLCYYSIAVAVRAWSAICTPERDLAEIDALIADYRAHVGRTTVHGPEWIEGFEAQTGGGLTEEDCTRSDVEGLATAVLDDVAAYRAGSETLLASDEPPVWGICL